MQLNIIRACAVDSCKEGIVTYSPCDVYVHVLFCCTLPYPTCTEHHAS